MIEKNREEAFLEEIKKRLDRSVEEIDHSILSRLSVIRNKALEKEKKRDLLSRNWFRVAAVGFATALVVIMVTMFQLKKQSPPDVDHGLEDVEILASPDDLDLYTHLEFYTWLAAEQKNAG